MSCDPKHTDRHEQKSGLLWRQILTSTRRGSVKQTSLTWTPAYSLLSTAGGAVSPPVCSICSVCPLIPPPASPLPVLVLSFSLFLFILLLAPCLLILHSSSSLCLSLLLSPCFLSPHLVLTHYPPFSLPLSCHLFPSRSSSFPSSLSSFSPSSFSSTSISCSSLLPVSSSCSPHPSSSVPFFPSFSLLWWNTSKWSTGNTENCVSCLNSTIYTHYYILTLKFDELSKQQVATSAVCFTVMDSVFCCLTEKSRIQIFSHTMICTYLLLLLLLLPADWPQASPSRDLKTSKSTLWQAVECRHLQKYTTLYNNTKTTSYSTLKNSMP